MKIVPIHILSFRFGYQELCMGFLLNCRHASYVPPLYLGRHEPRWATYLLDWSVFISQLHIAPCNWWDAMGIRIRSHLRFVRRNGSEVWNLITEQIGTYACEICLPTRLQKLFKLAKNLVKFQKTFGNHQKRIKFLLSSKISYEYGSVHFGNISLIASARAIHFLFFSSLTKKIHILRCNYNFERNCT